MRKKTEGIKILSVLLISMVFCMSLSACREQEKKKVEITVIHGWGSDEKDHVAMRQIYEDFEKENRDVDVHLISMPTSKDLVRKVGDLLLVGERPDVIFFGGTGNSSIYNYMLKNDLAVDYIPYIESDDEFRNNISPANMEEWKTVEGKLFSISDTLMLSGGYWFNKDIFQQAGIESVPESWDEFLKVCASIEKWSGENRKEIKPLQVSSEGYLYLADHMLLSIGKKESEIRDWSKMKAEDMEKILPALRTLYRYSFPDDKNYSYRDEKDLFNEGKIAICINGVWGAPMIEKYIEAEYGLLPSDGTCQIACESAGRGYVVGKTGEPEREKAAVDFVKYMLSDSVQERILKETEQVPANPGVSLLAYKEEMERFYQAAELVKGAEIKIETPDRLWEGGRRRSFEENIFELLSGKITTEEFMTLLE